MDPVIRTRQDAMAAVEVYSPAEQQFNERRRAAGLALSPIAFLALLLLPLGLPPAAHRLCAVMGLMLVLWVTEAIPVAVTALLGPALAVFLRVGPAKDVFAPFADPIIFLFIGSFILAEAMRHNGLDRRVAYGVLAWPGVAGKPGRLLVVYGAVCAGVSMWISNTATAAMLFPIGLSIVTHLSEGAPGISAGARKYALALMLMTAFAASIGGIATPVGTPPNLIGLGMLRNLVGADISFVRWMVLGVPLTGVLMALLSIWFWWVGGRGVTVSPGVMDHVRRERQQLGPLAVGERNVVIAFTVTVTLWVLPGAFALAGAADSTVARVYAAAVPESVAALSGAILLFLLPAGRQAPRATITWDEAARIDWGTILLFGGGMAMGSLAYTTGLAKYIGETAAGWMPVQSTLAYTALFTVLAVILSETTSNTASATMLVPVAIAAAQSAGLRPLEPALGATLGASLGFMLPISTPPNAIAYSSGYIPITAMIKYGVLLDVVGSVIVVAAAMLLGPFLL